MNTLQRVGPIAYYNEIDPYAAAWLRNLIDAGLIAPGVVDERSIEDVKPEELHGFTQCHFFAGIGVWSYALRRAGWPDDRPVWTGSCPCQPFAAPGKGDAFADERHLWPAFFHLIAQRRPPVIIGEQVASKAVDEWIDLVQADMEGVDYAFAAIAFPSAGVGAPHIRDRAYWLGGGAKGRSGSSRSVAAAGVPRELADASRIGWREECSDVGGGAERNRAQGNSAGPVPVQPAGGMADAVSERHDGRGDDRATAGAQCGGAATAGCGDDADSPAAGPVNGFWRAADWLLCRDGKWRPVESGTFPLAHGAPARVGRLRAYGNAINAEAAEAVIRAAMPLLGGA